MAKTLAQLRAVARSKSDTTNRAAPADGDVNGYVNEGIKALYDLIISVDPSYYQKAETPDFSVSSTPTGNTHTLPADFYKERLLLLFPDTTQERPIFSIGIAERMTGRRGYTLDGSSLRIWPYMTAGQGPYRLIYTPKAPQLANDSDPLDATMDNWDDYPSLYAAVIIKRSREKDPTDLIGVPGADPRTQPGTLLAIEARVQAMAAMRQGEPEQAPRMRRRPWMNPDWDPDA